MASAAAVAVFAGKTVASGVIKEIVAKAFGYLNGYFGAETMAELQRKLDQRMLKVQVVLDIIASPDQAKGKSGALDAWFWQLRDAVEKAENAIDELKYYELEEKAHDRKVSDSGSSFAKIKHKAAKKVKNNISILDKTVKGFTHRGTLKRLKEAVEDLDRAAESAMDFFTLAEHLKGPTIRSEQESSLNRDRETASSLTATEVFGRHEEKERVMRWLTEASDIDAETVVSSNPVSVVSIVGHGGMGKTTLAQSICNDGAINTHFDKVIWACVSTDFDATTVTKKILESVTWRTPDANTLDALQKILREELDSVKFLLILDDVWDDNKTDQWDKLFAPLKTGKSGSKILLTTRMQSVADLAAYALASKSKSLPLIGLKEDENIKLFNSHAFRGKSLQHYADLQPIGEQIAKNLRGCPLVTKVVALHLQGRLSLQYWSDFLHQRLGHFGGTTEDIMNVLKLSYFHLPTEMQTCFRYCSIFPQDFLFDKKELVNMWVSSGLISQVAPGSGSLISTGEQYLDQLTRKSFFDHARFESDKYCVMHDLMHDLAQYVSSGECARIVDAASLEVVPRTVRHICIEDIGNLPVDKIIEITHPENLRTIIIRDKENRDRDKKNFVTIEMATLNAVEELVVSSKSLRVFQTELNHTSHFVGKFAMLKHLRIVKLPRVSHNYGPAPKEPKIPPESVCGVVKLHHLTTFKCRGLEIEGDQLEDVANMEAHLDFVELNISNLSGTKITIWREKLFVGNIVDLELERLTSCEQLLSLEKLISVTSLRLKNLPRMKKIGREFGISGNECTELFWPPNLWSLDVMYCPKLKELPPLPPRLVHLCIKEVGLTKFPGQQKLYASNGDWIFRRLRSLDISRCCKLAEAGLSQNMDVSGGGEKYLVVKDLTIDLPSLLLVEPLNNLCDTTSVTISEASKMESIPERWLLQNRSSLKYLVVEEARSLESLPSSMSDLSSLKDLSIISAVKLGSLPDLPSSLRWLYLPSCHSELEKKLRESGSPERKKSSHVQRAEIGDFFFIMGKQCNKEIYDELRGKDYNTLSSWANQQDNLQVPLS